jgi:CHAD domain-containing protein
MKREAGVCRPAEDTTMKSIIDMHRLHLKIKSARQAVEEIKELSEDFPAAARNAERILASLKMLDINIGDLVDLGA